MTSKTAWKQFGVVKKYAINRSRTDFSTNGTCPCVLLLDHKRESNPISNNERMLVRHAVWPWLQNCVVDIKSTTEYLNIITLVMNCQTVTKRMAKPVPTNCDPAWTPPPKLTSRVWPQTSLNTVGNNDRRQPGMTATSVGQNHSAEETEQRNDHNLTGNKPLY